MRPVHRAVKIDDDNDSVEDPARTRAAIPRSTQLCRRLA